MLSCAAQAGTASPLRKQASIARFRSRQNAKRKVENDAK
jgi:hypothetical protein